MQTRYIKIIIAAAVVAVAIGGLVVTATETGVTYYHTPSEFLPAAAEYAGQIVRINGKVVAGSVTDDTKQKGGVPTVRFVLGDSAGVTIPVVYTGTEIPDAFGDDADVVVEGEVSSQGEMEARKLLVKCPAKYEAAEEDGQESPHPISDDGA